MMVNDKLKLDVLVTSDLNSWMSMPHKKRFLFEKRMARAIIRGFRRVGVDCKVLEISLQLWDNQTLACAVNSWKLCQEEDGGGLEEND